jgi:hypothetical protein
MGGFLMPVERWTVFQNGEPAAGARLYTYLSGSSTPYPVFNNADLLLIHAHTNPVIADSTGTFPVIYLEYVNYRFLVTDALGVTIFPAQDDIQLPVANNTVQVFTPGLLNQTNITSSVAFPFQYMRVGNVVTVSGKVTITPTAASSFTQLGLDLPIGTTFTTDSQAAGTAATQTSMVGAMSATGNFVTLTFVTGTSLAATDWWLHYTYLLLP